MDTIKTLKSILLCLLLVSCTNPSSSDKPSTGTNNSSEVSSSDKPNTGTSNSSQTDSTSSTDTLKSGLVAYYPFNGDANDMAATNNGSVVNATLTTDRNNNANKAYSFDGKSYINSNFNFNGTLTDFSFSYWVKFIDQTGTQKIFNFQEGGQGGLELSNDNTSGLRFVLIGANQSNGATIYNTSFTNGTWYHVVTTFNKTSQKKKIYINKNLVLNSASPSTITALVNSTLRIGGAKTGMENLKGCLDDFRIYNKELTQNEVLSLYSFTD